MTRAQRELIRVKFHGTCAYCGVSENSVGSALTIDHFKPQSQGGGDEEENLVLCCHACNEFKGEFWPQDEIMLPLLHPSEDTSQHLKQSSDGMILGLTPRGEAHIARLRLNRTQAVSRRLNEQIRMQLQARLEAALKRIEVAERTAVEIAIELEKQKHVN